MSTLTRSFSAWRVSALLRVTLVAALSALLLVMLGGSTAQARSPAVFYGNNAGFGTDRLEKFDKATGTLLQTYTPSTGNGRGVVVVGNIIYSTVVGDSNIYKTDATTGAPLGTIPTAVASMSTIAWDGSHFWTTDYSGPNRGFELDVAGNVIKTITFPLATSAMDGMEYFTAATNTLPAGGKLIVNRKDGGFGGPNIYDIYDLDGNVLTPAFITATNGTGIGYDGQNFYVSDVFDNLVNVFDGMTGAFISSVPLGGPSHNIEDVSFDYSLTLTQISTSLSGGGQSGPTITVPAGTAVTDSSTLSGVDASTATGTVTYSVYNDSQCQNQVGDGGTKTVTNGVVPDSDALTFNSGGPFYWQASYSGDVNHNSSTTACGDEVETLTTPPPTGTITVHKTVDAGGASPTSFCFTLSPDPGNGEICADSNGDAVFNDVPTGTYDANETKSASGYHQVSNDCTGLIVVGGDSLKCDVHDTFTPIAHDVDAHLGIGTDIGLGTAGTKVTDVKSDCKNETPAENVHCTLQVSGLPAGCTAKSSRGPVVTSPGGFLLNDLSFYAVNQTKHFDFKLTITCTPNLAQGVVAILQFKQCADGGFIGPNPCVDSDITPDGSPNVVVKSVKLHR